MARSLSNEGTKRKKMICIGLSSFIVMAVLFYALISINVSSYNHQISSNHKRHLQSVVTFEGLNSDLNLHSMEPLQTPTTPAEPNDWDVRTYSSVEDVFENAEHDLRKMPPKSKLNKFFQKVKPGLVEKCQEYATNLRSTAQISDSTKMQVVLAARTVDLVLAVVALLTGDLDQIENIKDGLVAAKDVLPVLKDAKKLVKDGTDNALSKSENRETMDEMLERMYKVRKKKKEDRTGLQKLADFFDKASKVSAALTLGSVVVFPPATPVLTVVSTVCTVLKMVFKLVNWVVEKHKAGKLSSTELSHQLHSGKQKMETRINNAVNGKPYGPPMILFPNSEFDSELEFSKVMPLI